MWIQPIKVDIKRLYN